jgi:RHS repeat-associated protein
MQPSAARAVTSDKTYYVALDERWRIAGVYRESDTSPKEAFVYHAPGNSGYGGSGYIDDVILRDRDHNSGWTSAADGTLEQRRYYCQNWRHDAVAMIKSDGKIAERDRYLSYGTPFGSPLADATFDGTVSASDTTQVNSDWGANYHVRSDFNLDGAVGAADSAEVTANSGKTLGWGTLSDMTNVANRKGYAGYEIDVAISKLYHVRYRALHAELGRWTRRDPLGYVDSFSLYQYLASRIIANADPTGLVVAIPCNGTPPTQAPPLSAPQWPPPPLFRPPPLPPNPTAIQCCQQWQFEHPGLGGATVCCNGIPIACVNDDYINTTFPWPGIAAAMLDCYMQCEPTHCDNIACGQGVTGDPQFPDPLMPIHCSECDAFNCLLDCIEAKCGDPHQCTLCQGNPDCINTINNFYHGLSQRRDTHCFRCDLWRRLMTDNSC